MNIFSPTRLTFAGLVLFAIGDGFAQEATRQNVSRNEPNSKAPVSQTLTLQPASRELIKSEPPIRETLRELQPAERVESEKPEKHEEVRHITLHLDDVDVRKALELLSREGSLNILVSPGVNGRVTANLENLLPEAALAAILRLANLVALRESGLIYVYTPQEMTELKERDRKLSTRVYHLNYLRGSDLEKLIVPFLSPDGKVAVTPGSEVGIKSNTEHAGGDSLASGDAVVVQDFESVLQTIDRILAELDVQPIQVLIEAVIMQVELSNSTDLGVNFAVLDGAGRVITALGNGAEINAAAGFRPNELLVAGSGNLKGDPTTSKAIGGLAANSHGIKFGFVDKDVTGFIHALEEVGKLNVLASPRLLVLNKQRAELIIGDRIGYKTLIVTETASVEKVEFLNVGTQLRLRPFVAQDGMIRMEIHPERSTGIVDEKGLPQTSTSEVTTNVIVEDGSTIVIGGLMQEEKEIAQSGVPFLSRLRWVGALFRQKSDKCRKKELIVLLTPHIYRPAERCATPILSSRTLPHGDQALELWESPTETAPFHAPTDKVREPSGLARDNDSISQAHYDIPEPRLVTQLWGPRNQLVYKAGSYRIVVSNVGESDIGPLQLSVELPTNLLFTPDYTVLGDYDLSTHSVGWSLEPIGPGQRCQVRLVLTPTKAAEDSRLVLKVFSGDTLLGSAERRLTVQDRDRYPEEKQPER